MSPPSPIRVVNLSLGGSERDYDEHVTFLGQDFHVVRVRADEARFRPGR